VDYTVAELRKMARYLRFASRAYTLSMGALLEGDLTVATYWEAQARELHTRYRNVRDRT